MPVSSTNSIDIFANSVCLCDEDSFGNRWEMLDEYKNYIQRALKTKKIPIQPGVILTKDNCPEPLDPKEQKFYCSLATKVQFVARKEGIFFPKT